MLFIFNSSFETGIVPAGLKKAKVIPVFKKGQRSSPSNYRPISMLSVFDEFLGRLMNFLTKYKILNKYQFGFRRGHSTSMALIEVMDWIYENIEHMGHK